MDNIIENLDEEEKERNKNNSAMNSDKEIHGFLMETWKVSPVDPEAYFS